MAKREFSSNLHNLKFMQRAKQREEVLKKAEQDATITDETHWTVPSNNQASGKKCIVIMEGDPKPGALLGRMSFQNCNTSIDKLVEEAEALHKRRYSTAKEKAEAALAATSVESPSESMKREDANVEEEMTAQFKKPKMGILDNKSASAGVERLQSGANLAGKSWQGWRSSGDYRTLRPPPKGS